MAYENPFLAWLAAGKPAIGCWATTTETVIAEVLGHAGYDFVIVDMQHGTIELSTLAPVLQAIQAGGGKAIVRVPSHEYRDIGKALDLGALAIVVPLVETAEEAAAAVSACRFPPHGTRSWGAIRTGLLIGNEEPRELERFGCFVMIETVRGLENVAAIAAVEGTDRDLRRVRPTSPSRSGCRPTRVTGRTSSVHGMSQPRTRCGMPADAPASCPGSSSATPLVRAVISRPVSRR